MKLNARLIKHILSNIQEKESHYVSTKDIYDDIQPRYEEIDAEVFKDLFYGHLLLLKDNKVIEEVSKSVHNLGIEYSLNGQMVAYSCFIRLTSKGYDYIKVLNKSGFIEKLKNLTLTEGLKISEYALLKGVEHYIQTKF